MAVYLLDLALTDDPDHLEYETGIVPVFAPEHTSDIKNWTLLRALKTSFPNATYLKDLLPHTDSSWFSGTRSCQSIRSWPPSS